MLVNNVAEGARVGIRVSGASVEIDGLDLINTDLPIEVGDDAVIEGRNISARRNWEDS